MKIAFYSSYFCVFVYMTTEIDQCQTAVNTEYTEYGPIFIAEYERNQLEGFVSTLLMEIHHRNENFIL